MAYFQQQAIMFSTRGPKFDLRKAFIDELIKFINSLQAAGDYILVRIDANAGLESEKQKIDRLLRECCLTDLLKCFPEESDPPETYN